ncbi:MAG: hypothetical protein ACR2OO_10530 [Thermomicrobiales bacterium]
MDSLLNKMTQDSSDTGQTDPAQAAAPAGGGLLAAMQSSGVAAHPEVQQAQAQLQQAATTLDPNQFQSATSSGLGSVSPEDRSVLAQILQSVGANAGLGAASGAGTGLQGQASDPSSLAKMLHWVQTNVPGGIPTVLAAAGAVGGAAAVAGTGHGGDVADAVGDAASASLSGMPGGDMFSSVLGAIMPAISGAVSKLGG